jgi:hypothetical protein
VSVPTVVSPRRPVLNRLVKRARAWVLVRMPTGCSLILSTSSCVSRSLVGGASSLARSNWHYFMLQYDTRMPGDTLLHKAMYRCYLVRAGRIAMGDDLNVDTFDEAIARGRKLLAAQPEAENFSGIEIWHRARLLYSDDCYEGNAGDLGPVISPFQTGEGTIFTTWHPSVADLYSR